MIRNLKVLGLALIAVCALGAMAASGASADAFTAEAAPVTLTGKHDPNTPADTFSTTSGTVNCPNATYHGTQKTTSATSITITPSFGHCTAFGLPAVIDTNGCKFTFNINGKTETTGTIDIHECTGPNDITVTGGQNTEGTLTTKCTVHVPEQTGINGVTYKNVPGPPKEITIEIHSTNITYTHTSGTGLGACVGGGLTHQSNGKFDGFEIVTGEVDPSGADIGIFLSNL